MLSVHKNCVYYCPEVVIEDIIYKAEKPDNFQLDKTQDDIVQLLCID